MRIQLGAVLHDSLNLLMRRLVDSDDCKRPVFVIALGLQDGQR